MKILIAGKGFIGGSISERLKDDHEVKFLSRTDADYEYDVTDSFSVDESFDLIIHTIGLAPGFSSEAGYRNVHVEGTENIIEAIDADKIIYISALNAGKIDHSYFDTKKKAEEIVKKSEMSHTIIRPSIVWGRGNKLLDMIRKTAYTRIFPKIGTETQPIDIKDLSKTVEKLIGNQEGKILKIAGPETYSFGELAKIIYNQEGYSCFLVPYPRFLLELKLIGLSFLPPPFQRENINLLRNGNKTDENDASDIINLNKVS